MTESVVLDIALVLLIVGYLVQGFRTGFARSLSGFIGVVVGGIAAFFAIPVVSGWVTTPEWRVPVTLAAAVGLLLIGHAIGAYVGRSIQRTLKNKPLRGVDRLLGAGLSGVASALILSLLAVGVGSLGVPMISRTIASSQVLGTIDDLTPDPVKAFLAQVRSVAVNQGIPLITEAIGGITTAPSLPDVSTSSPALSVAAQSVVRVVGNAAACGQSQSGSGFIIAPDRIVTTAHVVAGVTEPVVQTLAGEALTGRIVYFDPVDDLAVIAVSDIIAEPLRRAPTLEPGSSAVANGYPYGGPFSSVPAEVLSVDTANIENVYGDGAAPREIYSLATDIQQGDSGGPLLAETGEVVGVIFAKSSTTANLGYAMTMAELDPVADAAARTSAVSSGTCIAG